ncbi:hypothetical protein EZS27_004361 [termite gut metagenome]|uniref:O-antigen ligase-related domain-containing protein n=1 Tax=termite gut metagenome TaxID=433724 RepID=A0A5J4SSN0_9ZZZZ
MKKGIVVYLIFILFVIYYLQGFLYSSGSILSQGCLFLIIVISFLYFIRTVFHKNIAFYKLWTVLFLLNTVYFFFGGDYKNENVGMYKNIIMVSLIFYPFYYFSLKGWLNKKKLIIFFLIMIPITIIQYYVNISSHNVSFNENFTNNVSYSFVQLIPFVFLIDKKRKLTPWMLIAILLSFTLLGSKRGAIIVGSIAIILYLYFQLKTTKTIKLYFFVILGIILIVLLSMQIIKNNDYLQSRYYQTIEGNSSGRDKIYSSIFNKWLNSDAKNFFLGFGFASSVTITDGTYAHNDWLELLSNCGLFGCVIYICLFIVAIRSIIKSNWNLDKRILMTTIILMWFATTLFSVWYTSSHTYPNVMLIAYLLGTASKSLE